MVPERGLGQPLHFMGIGPDEWVRGICCIVGAGPGDVVSKFQGAGKSCCVDSSGPDAFEAQELCVVREE